MALECSLEGDVSYYVKRTSNTIKDLPGFSVVGENSITEQREEITPPSLAEREIVKLGCQHSLDILGIHCY